MRYERQSGVLLAILPSYILVILDTSVVNVALESISQTFTGSIDGLQWIVSSYTVVFGSLLLCGGYLGDRFGPRLCYSLGLAIFGVASLLCGLSPSAPALIAFRALQGIGAALLVPNSLALISIAFPAPADRSWAIGLWAGCGGIAMASGPLLGGVLIYYLGWRSIFVVNIPVAITGLYLIYRTSVPGKTLSSASFDFPGQLVSIAAIGLTIALLIEAPTFGWASLNTISLSAVAIGLWIALPLIERGRQNPMLPPSLFLKTDFLGGVYVTFVSALVFYGFFFLLGLELQRSFGYSPLETGYRLLPLTIAVGVGSLMASRVTAAMGERNAVILSLFLYGVGFFYIQAFGSGGDYFSIAVAFPFIGLAAGAITPATTVVLMRGVEPHQSGIAAGIQNASRQIGAALGVAVFGIILAQTSPSSMPLRPASWLALGFIGSALLFWVIAFRRNRR